MTEKPKQLSDEEIADRLLDAQRLYARGVLTSRELMEREIAILDAAIADTDDD